MKPNEALDAMCVRWCRYFSLYSFDGHTRKSGCPFVGLNAHCEIYDTFKGLIDAFEAIKVLATQNVADDVLQSLINLEKK